MGGDNQKEELLTSIIDKTSSIIYIKDLEGRFTLANKQMADSFNTTITELIGKTVFELCPRQYAVQYTESDQIVLKEERSVEVREDALINGEVRYFYTVKFPLHDDTGRINAIGGISTDITNFIFNERLAQQKQILETALQVQENERMEIGLELHDNVTQLLATSKILINAAISMPYKMDECLTKSKEFIMRALKELRDISHSMLPPPMESEAFLQSIREIGENIQISTNMQFELRLPGVEDAEKISKELKLAIYRIIQEQVNNMHKHSGATRVKLVLRVKKDRVELSIEDNGVGIATEKKSRGIGLKNIENRVKMFNGSLDIISSPNQGFHTYTKFPL